VVNRNSVAGIEDASVEKENQQGLEKNSIYYKMKTIPDSSLGL
jgi:hypothetical protein